MTPKALPISARTNCANADCGKALTWEQRADWKKFCSTACAQADAMRAVQHARPIDYRPLRDRSA